MKIKFSNKPIQLLIISIDLSEFLHTPNSNIRDDVVVVLISAGVLLPEEIPHPLR